MGGSPKAPTQESVEEYVINRIVYSAPDEDNLKMRYRARSDRYPPKADTWEPIENLTQSHVVRNL